MIIVQLSGGLGNQLFQYAMGYTLAQKSKCELKLDLLFFENYEWHDYSLKPFAIQENIATMEEIEALRRRERSLPERVKRKLFNVQPFFIQEKNLLFDDFYLNIKRPAYLMGYWQCEKYFEKCSAAIREQFTVCEAPSLANRDLLQKISVTEAVSLHIRRGNFVNVDFINKIHGTCSLDYYSAAIKYVAAKCSKPVFYIFSDDMAWVKENIKVPYHHHFVDLNDAQTDYEDLRLMYSCKHHIIANSTFSWWGAWLSIYKNKIIIAPKKWYADPEKEKYTLTIVPDIWIRL